MALLTFGSSAFFFVGTVLHVVGCRQHPWYPLTHWTTGSTPPAPSCANPKCLHCQMFPGMDSKATPSFENLGDVPWVFQCSFSGVNFFSPKCRLIFGYHWLLSSPAFLSAPLYDYTLAHSSIFNLKLWKETAFIFSVTWRGVAWVWISIALHANFNPLITFPQLWGRCWESTSLSPLDLRPVNRLQEAWKGHFLPPLPPPPWPEDPGFGTR